MCGNVVYEEYVGHKRVGHEHVFGGKNMVGLLLGWCLLLGVFGKCCR